MSRVFNTFNCREDIFFLIEIKCLFKNVISVKKKKKLTVNGFFLTGILYRYATIDGGA